MTTELQLIPLQIETRGEVLKSNLPVFRENVTAWLDTINKNLTTDDHFAQAEADIKQLKSAEAALKAGKEKAITDSAPLRALLDAIDEAGEEIAKIRLNLEKNVKTKKADIKLSLIAAARERLACADHHKATAFDGLFESHISNKRTINTINEALDKAVAQANATVLGGREIINDYVTRYGAEIAPDAADLELKGRAVAQTELIRRVEARRAAEEKKRLEDEAAKARAEADQARQAAAEANKPPLPPQPPLCMTPEMEAKYTEKETQEAPSALELAELEQFKSALKSAFSEIKPARAALTHERNIAKAAAFADTLNKAWQTLNTLTPNMNIWPNMEQRSEAWFKARAGRPTASQFSKIITPGGADSKSWHDYALELSAECMRNDEVAWEGNIHTDRGEALEPEARDLFASLMPDLAVEEVGFITRDDNYIGCSPDALVYQNGKLVGGLEIKCPLTKNHAKYLMEGQLPDQYKPQVHGSMAVTGLNYWYFMSYAPKCVPFILRVERDAYTEKVGDALDRFLTFYAAQREKILEALTGRKAS